jgi:hypothetical protein
MLSLPSPLQPQEASAGDFDLELRADRPGYAPSDAVRVEAGLAVRARGVEGWSYGVRHDSAVLFLDSVTTDGSALLRYKVEPSFELTRVVDGVDGTPSGFVQAVVLSFDSPVDLPLDDFHVLATATYGVLPDACSGRSDAEEVTTALRFASDLRVPASPEVDVVLAVRGRAVRPGVVRGAEIAVHCARQAPELRLTLAGGGGRSLRADRTATLDLQVRIENPGTAGTVGVQGWSYGLELNRGLLEPLVGVAGVHAAALHGGSGPQYVEYNLDEPRIGGGPSGITVGAVVELGPPGTEVLPVSAGSSVHLDTVRVRSAVEIPAGGAARRTTVRFADGAFGFNQPIEVLLVVDGSGIVPDFGAGLEVTLLPIEPETAPFIRGDANNDARVDIADGVWVINMLFRAGPPTACAAAADANSSGRVELGDALYIFQFQLQVGATAANPFPSPAAPFPNCGTAASVPIELCPVGSHVCSG